MTPTNICTVRQCWATLLLVTLAASSAPTQGLARSLSSWGYSRGPWSPSHQCVKELDNTDISPTTRGRTTEETYTYEKKFDDIDDCFEECQGHFIVYGKNSGRCYCWREQGCQAVGFCDDGDCPGEPFGTWGSDSTMVVYDQSGCYGNPCEKYTGMGDSSDSEEEDSSDSEEEKDSSDSEEEKDSSDSEEGNTKGPWRPCEEGEPCEDDQYREQCDEDGDSIWNENEGWACTGDIAGTYMPGFEVEWKSTHGDDNPWEVESVVYDGSLDMCHGLMPRGYWEEENYKKYLDPVISGAGGRYNWVMYNHNSGSCSILDRCESLATRSGVNSAKYCNFSS